MMRVLNSHFGFQTAKPDIDTESKRPGYKSRVFFVCERWCPEAGSNHRHADFQSTALPTELSGHLNLSSLFPECPLRNEPGYTNSFGACPDSNRIFFPVKILLHLQGLRDTRAAQLRELRSFHSTISQGQDRHSVSSRTACIFLQPACHKQGSPTLLFLLCFFLSCLFLQPVGIFT